MVLLTTVLNHLSIMVAEKRESVLFCLLISYSDTTIAIGGTLAKIETFK